LLKLPSHSSHRLQPLDFSCFRSLKAAWDKALVTFQRQSNFVSMTKSNFVDLLGQVWPIALTQTNILSGFRETGIFPLDRCKYPKSLFDPVKLQSYEFTLRGVEMAPTLNNRQQNVVSVC
jgi:hypothetical protein